MKIFDDDPYSRIPLILSSVLSLSLAFAGITALTIDKYLDKKQGNKNEIKNKALAEDFKDVDLWDIYCRKDGKSYTTQSKDGLDLRKAWSFTTDENNTCLMQIHDGCRAIKCHKPKTK